MAKTCYSYQRISSLSLLLTLLLFSISEKAVAQRKKEQIVYTVSMDNPASQHFQVSLIYTGTKSDSVDFKMPVWTPGYYQILDYANNVKNFRADSKASNALKWKQVNKNTWRVYNGKSEAITLNYDVKATETFVAKNYLDETRGYISPAGLFMHVAENLEQPITVNIKPYKNWKNVATGLNPVAGKPYTYTAPNFDILYDSPILIGNLEELPDFEVGGKPHRFIGYKLGEFDRVQLVSDLKKIVESASNLIGHIPYEHYTFIAIGPGRGGIEHLNSTTISFDGAALIENESRLNMLSFLAHEYFHHYNAKRIRPIELGPFDYDQENRTNMLWVAEGGTVYYEYLVLRDAGLMTNQVMIDALRSHLISYENKPGRLFQSATQASYQTWSDGPFGRTDDGINKTISVYDKGPILNLLLDFKIRHESGNKKSLDDVMRTLYREYYQKKQRGYTEAEFWELAESMAGTALTELKECTSTVKRIDYPKYFAYAGLSVDTTATAVPGAYSGFKVKQDDNGLKVTAVDLQSPAWEAGIRVKDQVQSINGKKAIDQNLKTTMDSAKSGEALKLVVLSNGEEKVVKLVLGTQMIKHYTVNRLPDPTPLQKQILKSWLRE